MIPAAQGIIPRCSKLACLIHVNSVLKQELCRGRTVIARSRAPENLSTLSFISERVHVEFSPRVRLLDTDEHFAAHSSKFDLWRLRCLLLRLRV